MIRSHSELRVAGYFVPATEASPTSMPDPLAAGQAVYAAGSVNVPATGSLRGDACPR